VTGDLLLVTGSTTRFFNSWGSFASDLSEVDCLKKAQTPGFAGINSVCAAKKLTIADTHPPVFSVRVANKGLMLDAASRFASKEVTEGIVCGLEGSKVGLRSKGEQELSALRLRAWGRFGVEVAGGEALRGSG